MYGARVSVAGRKQACGSSDGLQAASIEAGFFWLDPVRYGAQGPVHACSAPVEAMQYQCAAIHGACMLTHWACGAMPTCRSVVIVGMVALCRVKTWNPSEIVLDQVAAHCHAPLACLTPSQAALNHSHTHLPQPSLYLPTAK
jgi:hypothetical protein